MMKLSLDYLYKVRLTINVDQEKKWFKYKSLSNPSCMDF